VTMVANEPVRILDEVDSSHSGAGGSGSRIARWQGSPMVVHVGLGLVASGFLLILFAWAKVAGLDSVPQQLPYLLSGGITGLGLILVGLAVVHVGALHAAERERARELDRLANLVESLLARHDARADG
jgi:hypothetical protein